MAKPTMRSLAATVALFCHLHPYCFLTTEAAWTGASVPQRVRRYDRLAEKTMRQWEKTSSSNCGLLAVSSLPNASTPELKRREALLRTAVVAAAVGLSPLRRPNAALAYTPDPDKLRESLYLISRVQEATVQQERFVNNAELQEELKRKMKLTLRLVEKNYRLLDQINYASNFVEPKDEIVAANEAGNEAVEALQSAIDYVYDELGIGPFADGQREYLTSNLRTCREKIFVFLRYMPAGKLQEARLRVEEENVKNREEFDGDGSEGVYNPVILPWKQ